MAAGDTREFRHDTVRGIVDGIDSVEQAEDSRGSVDQRSLWMA